MGLTVGKTTKEWKKKRRMNMMDTKITLAMVAQNAPAFKSEETMESLVIPEPVKAEDTMESLEIPQDCGDSDDTMQAIARNLPKQETQVNYLWHLYSNAQRSKQNPQPEVKRTEGFDPLSSLALRR